jgi:hypothetical protein
LTVAATILLIVIAVAVAAFAFNAIRVAGQSAERAVEATMPVPKHPMPRIADFHVRGDTARTTFEVPLGKGPAGQHLTDLLCAAAVEYVREKTEEGLPLEDVERIEVFAMRGDEPELIGTVDLPEVGTLPDRDVKVLVELTHDPIAAVAEVVADTSITPPSSGTSTLQPVSEFVELPAPVEARLRSIGVDTGSMSLEELVLGLLRVSGYDARAGGAGFEVANGKASLFGLTRNGKKTSLVILPHEEGTHPELEEKILSEFAVGVAQTNPDEAILVTDKYSPYSMYEREKRDKRLLFITRERLQSFVDSFSVR